MIKYNKSDYSSKTIMGLLIFSLMAVPLAVEESYGNTGDIVAQTDNHETDSDNHEIDADNQIIDPVLNDHATSAIFAITQDSSETLYYPPKAKKNSPAAKKKDGSVAPIVIEADKLSYNDTTGEILAYGKVIITRDGEKVETEELQGNSQTGVVWTQEQVLFSKERARFTSDNILYDYNQKTGELGATKGRINRDFVTGEHIDILPDRYVVTQGTSTSCPAKIPDYHISAEKIEIWPDEKMILYKPKFLIKNHVIFSMAKYQISLKKNDKEQAFPRIGYRSSDGVYIEQHLAYPISRTTSVFTDLNYYSKAHFQPSYGIRDSQRNYTTQIVAGYFVDGNDNWVKKEMEFKWDYHPRRIGSSAFSYRFGFSYGKWSDERRTSWHQSYNLYLSHDPIRLSKTTFLRLGGGVEHIRESYNKSQQNVPIFRATLTQRFSPRLNGWVSYRYKKYERRPIFSYSIPEIPREINYGFTYKIDRLNTIGLTYRYDQDKGSLNDIYYTWYRNLHCWESVLTYKSKAQSWEWTMNIVRW